MKIQHCDRCGQNFNGPCILCMTEIELATLYPHYLGPSPLFQSWLASHDASMMTLDEFRTKRAGSLRSILLSPTVT